MRLVHDVEKEYHDCNGSTYVAKEDNRVIGRLCTRKLGWFGIEFCHLFVNENSRRQGVATFMNKELFKLYDKSVIMSTVRVDNIPSQMLMKSLGFMEVINFISKNSGKLVTLFVYKR